MDLSSNEIPLIDFGRYLNGNENDRFQVAKQIGDACRNIGFFYLSNHGIHSELIENVYQQARRFFSQNLDEKKKVFIGHCPSGNNRGYTPFFEEKLSTDGDFKEAFDLALELPENDSDRIERGANLYGPNFWPENLPGFRELIYDQYFLQMKNLGEKLLQCFSLALNLPENFFQSMFTKPMITMRLIHYPPQSSMENKNQLGCGAHTDYECFTILSQTNHSALQILNKKGQWINAKPIDQTFVVNIGDLMQIWTNGLFQSTVHRVINLTNEDRYSIPFFFGPNYFAEIFPLQNESTKENSSSTSSIIAGKYLTERFDQTYRYRQ